MQGRAATIERIYVDFDGRVQLAVTIDDVPGQDIMRDIRRYLYFRPDEVELIMSPSFQKQILVAGVGNAWMQDDGFGARGRPAAGAARAAVRRDRDGLRLRRARPRLRDHARLPRARADRRLAARAASPARCT